MKPFKKIVRIGTKKEYNSKGVEVDANIFCEIKYEKKQDDKYVLSITGVVGPSANGGALGSCGQICMSALADIDEVSPAPKWDKSMISQFMQIWDTWHLNDMNAATPEMKEAGWLEQAKKEIFLYSFAMTRANRNRMADISSKIERAALNDEAVTLSDEEKRLLKSPFYKDIYAYELPEAPEFMEQAKDFRNDYKAFRIERKTLGWVRPDEHPDGLLGRMLKGKGYGSAWYYEPVPDDVLVWLKALPDTDKMPAWI